MSIVKAGLTIDSLYEYPFTPHNCYGFLEEREPGRWYPRTGAAQVPMVFSIQASLPDGDGPDAPAAG
jgi:hypothetical protein